MRQSPKASTDVDTIDESILFGLVICGFVHGLYLVKIEKDTTNETSLSNPHT